MVSGDSCERDCDPQVENYCFGSRCCVAQRELHGGCQCLHSVCMNLGVHLAGLEQGLESALPSGWGLWRAAVGCSSFFPLCLEEKAVCRFPCGDSQVLHSHRHCCVMGRRWTPGFVALWLGSDRNKCRALAVTGETAGTGQGPC